ncbi:MAG: 50S ribosome-binding GTPase, partial [Planctomycetes bacterium]|nr:50S ribosome-binding GTPase [Planctomycetota bacterium]
MFPTDDTIAAISTPPGQAARAIVRVSGPDALAAAGRVFRPDGPALARMPGFRAADGRLTLAVPAAGTRADRPVAFELPARAYVFRAPRSYTGQDVVELHVPGAAPVVSAVLDGLLAAGARRAGPGEFTARAFLNGRMDLSRAAAVADIINADDDGRMRAAAAMLDGLLGRLTARARGELADCLALTEASIDLAEQDITLSPPGRLARRLERLAEELRDQAARTGPADETAGRCRVVLAGLPNAGKSSLLNALTGQGRAIVSPAAGTTRDVLTGSLKLPGGRVVVLQDAAGFAPADEPASAEETAACLPAARRRARRAAAAAEAICFVVDAAAGPTARDAALLDEIILANPRGAVFLLANKADLLGEARCERAVAEFLRNRCRAGGRADGRADGRA